MLSSAVFQKWAFYKDMFNSVLGFFAVKHFAVRHFTVKKNVKFRLGQIRLGSVFFFFFLRRSVPQQKILEPFYSKWIIRTTVSAGWWRASAHEGTMRSDWINRQLNVYSTTTEQEHMHAHYFFLSLIKIYALIHTFRISMECGTNSIFY